MTDGCTLVSDVDVRECCVRHDKYYWTGGNKQNRINADVEFKECVYDKTDKKLISQAMYGVVRIMGTPFIATPWRWGYGWEFGRGYR